MLRDNYVTAVPGTERQATADVPSASLIYKSKGSAPEAKEPQTLYDTFMASVAKFPNNDCAWRAAWARFILGRMWNSDASSE